MNTIAKTIGHSVRRVLALTNRSMPTFEEYMAELLSLNLARPFSVKEYMRALETQLGIEIKVVELTTGENSGLGTEFGFFDELAELRYDKKRREASILVSCSLREDPFLYMKTIYHELAHLAAGHPLRVGGMKNDLWWPPGRVAQRPASGDVSRNEKEADQRAEWSIIACVLGEKALHGKRSLGTF